jgi:hypothetical protein
MFDYYPYYILHENQIHKKINELLSATTLCIPIIFKRTAKDKCR